LPCAIGPLLLAWLAGGAFPIRPKTKTGLDEAACCCCDGGCGTDAADALLKNLKKLSSTYENTVHCLAEYFVT
jgi:hypothetical protein